MLPEADLARIYRSLRLIRRAEEETARVYPSDKIKSPVHLSIGQEAVAVGICDVLRPDDVVSGTYRGHAAYLAKGAPLKGMMAEMFGKATGAAGGKGGSMHLVSAEHNVLGASAVVGTSIPAAVGYALALKREGKGRVVAAFFGDGATEEGVFYESLNFASLHRLPILFVCENNGFAIHTPLSKRWASPAICDRVKGFGMPAQQIADGDVFAIRDAASRHIAAMRDRTGGPAFLECFTYRWREHVGPAEDYDAGYRDRQALTPWQTGDQVARVAGMLPADARKRIEDEVEREIAEALDHAETSPWPDPKELLKDVFAD